MCEKLTWNFSNLKICIFIFTFHSRLIATFPLPFSSVPSAILQCLHGQSPSFPTSANINRKILQLSISTRTSINLEFNSRRYHCCIPKNFLHLQFGLDATSIIKGHEISWEFDGIKDFGCEMSVSVSVSARTSRVSWPSAIGLQLRHALQSSRGGRKLLTESFAFMIVKIFTQARMTLESTLNSDN